MIFGDIKTVLVAAGALVIGLIAGNMRGELIGYDSGYSACQEATRKATRDANARALDEQDKLLPEEQSQIAKEAIAEAVFGQASDDECRDLTPVEIDALEGVAR